jgi:hypothetical protein
MEANPCINFRDLPEGAAGDVECLEEANDRFDALAEVAALSDCPVIKTIIAKPIVIKKTSLVVCIRFFSQVEVVEAFSFKSGENNTNSQYCNTNLFQHLCRKGNCTENSG